MTSKHALKGLLGEAHSCSRKNLIRRTFGFKNWVFGGRIRLGKKAELSKLTLNVVDEMTDFLNCKLSPDISMNQRCDGLLVRTREANK